MAWAGTTLESAGSRIVWSQCCPGSQASASLTWLGSYLPRALPCLTPCMHFASWGALLFVRRSSEPTHPLLCPRTPAQACREGRGQRSRGQNSEWGCCPARFCPHGSRAWKDNPGSPCQLNGWKKGSEGREEEGEERGKEGRREGGGELLMVI